MPAPPNFMPEFDEFGNPYGNIEEIKKINEEIDASSRRNARAQLDEFGFPYSLTNNTYYHDYPLKDTTVLRNEQPIMMIKSNVDTPMAISTPVSEGSSLEQTRGAETLNNEMTKSQKWAWVIGLTLAAWGLIYWSEKQANK
jgi:hypothetical protein